MNQYILKSILGIVLLFVSSTSLSSGLTDAIRQDKFSLLQQALNDNGARETKLLEAAELSLRLQRKKCFLAILSHSSQIVNKPNQSGKPLLVLAAELGRKAYIEDILSSQGNPNVTRSDGVTALMVASMRGDDDTVRILLLAGANRESRYQGKKAPKSALDLAGRGKNVSQENRDKVKDTLTTFATCQDEGHEALSHVYRTLYTGPEFMMFAIARALKLEKADDVLTGFLSDLRKHPVKRDKQIYDFATQKARMAMVEIIKEPVNMRHRKIAYSAMLKVLSFVNTKLAENTSEHGFKRLKALASEVYLDLETPNIYPNIARSLDESEINTMLNSDEPIVVFGGKTIKELAEMDIDAFAKLYAEVIIPVYQSVYVELPKDNPFWHLSIMGTGNYQAAYHEFTISYRNFMQRIDAIKDAKQKENALRQFSMKWKNQFDNTVESEKQHAENSKRTNLFDNSDALKQAFDQLSRAFRKAPASRRKQGA